MDYKKYQNARNGAWKILIDQHITQLPVQIVRICRNLDIAVKFNNNLTDKINSGRSTIIDSKPIIMVAPDCKPQRRRFTIAHELGHIILGHIGEYELINREPSPFDNPIEQEANVFASRLLAPACVLWGCDVQSAEDIAKLCDITPTAAKYRFDRYQILLKRNCFLSHPLERAVYSQFTDFINLQHQAFD